MSEPIPRALCHRAWVVTWPMLCILVLVSCKDLGEGSTARPSQGVTHRLPSALVDTVSIKAVCVPRLAFCAVQHACFLCLLLHSSSTRACLEVSSLDPHQNALFFLPLLYPQELTEKSRTPSPFCWLPCFYVSLRRLGGSSKVITGLPLPKRACMKHSVPMIPLSTYRDASLVPPWCDPHS